MVDINAEDVGYTNRADTDLNQISFIRVTKEGVQLVFLKEEKALVATKEPPYWLK